MIVEHNITLTGKSGRKRQVDVLITQRNKLHTYTTIVECKKWKDKVDGDVLDVIYAKMEDLNASKGVVFTTSGYEKGAEQYASSKNIDIFCVRDLRPHEWGSAGKISNIYLHTIAGEFITDLTLTAQMIPIVEEVPSLDDFKICLDRNYFDADQFLYSKRNGVRKGHLVDLLRQKHYEVLKETCEDISILDNGSENACLTIKRNVKFNFKNYDYRQLRLQKAVVNFDEIIGTMLIHISQSKFRLDIRDELDMALIVENYIKNQIHIVSKRNNLSDVKLSANLSDLLPKSNDGEEIIHEDNVVLKAFIDASVGVGEKIKTANDVLKKEKIIITL